MKKIITLVTGIAIMFGTSTVCFADAPSNGSNQANQTSNIQVLPQVGVQVGNTLTLSLDNCLNVIEKVNPSIKISDAKIKILKNQYDYDKSKSICPDSDDESSVGYNIQASYNWKKSENDLNNEKQDRDDKLKSLKVDLQKQYFGALADEKDIESIHAAMANLDKDIERTDAKVKLGLIDSTQLDTIKAKKSDLQSKLNSLQGSLESEQLKIKQYLNIDLNKEISLSPANKELVKFDENGIDLRIKNAVNKNHDLEKEENSISLLKSLKGIYMSYDTMNAANTVRGYDININQAQDKLANDKISTQIKILQSYYDLKNKDEIVQAEKLNLDVAEDNFNTIEIKFKSGMVDAIERENTRIAFEQQKNKYQRAVNDYMVTAESFKNLLVE